MFEKPSVALSCYILLLTLISKLYIVTFYQIKILLKERLQFLDDGLFLLSSLACSCAKDGHWRQYVCNSQSARCHIFILKGLLHEPHSFVMLQILVGNNLFQFLFTLFNDILFPFVEHVVAVWSLSSIEPFCNLFIMRQFLVSVNIR